MMECSIGPRHTSGLSPGLRKPTEMTFMPIPLGRQESGLSNYGWGFAGSQHQRNIGAIDIGVEQSDFVAHTRQRNSQIDGERGLTYATFPGSDCNDAVNSGKRLRRRRSLPGHVRMRAHVSLPSVFRM